MLLLCKNRLKSTSSSSCAAMSVSGMNRPPNSPKFHLDEKSCDGQQHLFVRRCLKGIQKHSKTETKRIPTRWQEKNQSMFNIIIANNLLKGFSDNIYLKNRLHSINWHGRAPVSFERLRSSQLNVGWALVYPQRSPGELLHLFPLP